MIAYHTCPLASEEGKETGGMNVYVLELSKQLANQGFLVDIYTRSQHPTNPATVEIAPNLRLFHLKAGPQEPVPKKELINFLPEFVDNFQKLQHKKNIKYNLLHCHYYLSGLIGLELKKYYKIPIIMYFHTLALMKNLVARDNIEREEVERINAENLLTQKADKIITPTESEFDYLQYLYNAKKEKITIIPPGVNTELFKPLDKVESKKMIGADQDEKMILFVGRLEPLKGLDMLLYAIKVLVQKNPALKTSLWIVGGDISQKSKLWSNQLKMLEKLRKLLNISMHVNFVGQQSQLRLPYYYNAAELVIMPSHYESFGIVALEAMACGTPVITTNVAGVSSLIDREHKSLITSVNNPLLLASQIEYLLTNEEICEKLSRDILKKAKGFDWQITVKKIIQIYQEVL